jgi:hypothetical protein
MRGLPFACLLLAAGCAAGSGGPGSTGEPTAPPAPFDARPFRQPAVFVRVEIRQQALSGREAGGIPAEYQGLLLEGLNAKAIVARDVTAVGSREKLDHGRALARAREVGADHALLVDVAVSRSETPFCRGTRRAFVASALGVQQRAVVIRAGDGAVRWTSDRLETASIEPDCETPRDSRRRSTTETLQAAVDRLLTRLLGR